MIRNGILLTFCAGLCWAINGIVISHTTRNKLGFYTVMTTASAACMVLTFLYGTDKQLLLSGNFPYPWQSIGTLVVSGLFAAWGFNVMHAALKLGHQGIIWTISQSAMAVPFLVSIIVFGDRVSPINMLGMLLIMVSFFLFGLNKRTKTAEKSTDMRWFWIALCAFFLLGIHQSSSTVPSYWEGWSDPAGIRSPALFLGISIGYGIPALKSRVKLTGKSLKMVSILICATAPAQIMMFTGIDYLVTAKLVAIAYPIAVGMSIIGFIVYSMLIIKEKTPVPSFIGLAAALAGLMMISM